MGLMKEHAMELTRLATAFGYHDDGQHIVLPFPVSPPTRRGRHPAAAGGKLTVSPTGWVSGMMLDRYDPTPFGTIGGDRGPPILGVAQGEPRPALPVCW